MMHILKTKRAEETDHVPFSIAANKNQGFYSNDVDQLLKKMTVKRVKQMLQAG